MQGSERDEAARQRRIAAARREQGKISGHLRWAFILILFLFCILTLRYGWLQLVVGED